MFVLLLEVMVQKLRRRLSGLSSPASGCCQLGEVLTKRFVLKPASASEAVGVLAHDCDASVEWLISANLQLAL